MRSGEGTLASPWQEGVGARRMRTRATHNTRRPHPASTQPLPLTVVGIWGKAWIVPVGAGAELGGVGTLASPWQEGAGARGMRTRATQASPPRLIPTPAPTGTKGLPCLVRRSISRLVHPFAWGITAYTHTSIALFNHFCVLGHPGAKL